MTSTSGTFAAAGSGKVINNCSAEPSTRETVTVCSMFGADAEAGEQAIHDEHSNAIFHVFVPTYSSLQP